MHPFAFCRDCLEANGHHHPDCAVYGDVDGVGGDSVADVKAMKTCKGRGCSRPAAAARGLCWGCYAKDRRAEGEPLYRAIQEAKAPKPATVTKLAGDTQPIDLPPDRKPKGTAH